MKTERQIEHLQNQIDELGTSKFPAMTYEQGVAAALAWVLDDDEPNPLED